MKRLIAALRNIGLFQKLFLAFVLIVVVPIALSYYFSQRATANVVVDRVFDETEGSLALAGSQVDDLLLRMIYVALYVNNDDNVRSILLESAHPDTTTSNGLQMWSRLKTFDQLFENLSFNLMRTKCYFSLVASSGYTYTNWPARGTEVTAYLAPYLQQREERTIDVHWVGLERNRIAAEAARSPYLLTLIKPLIGRFSGPQYGTLIVSIPEVEIRGLLPRGNSARQWFLVDGNQRVISGSVPAQLGTPILIPEVRSLAASTTGRFIADFPGTGRSLVSYRRMQNGQWNLITVESYVSITAELGRIRRQLLWWNIVAGVAFIAVAAVIARGMTWRIHALAEQMRTTEFETARGEAAAAVRSDEVGLLQRSYELMRRRIQRLMREVAQKEAKKREAELEALQLQVSPHFLFNTLASVRWAILNGNSTKAAEMTFALGSLLRMCLRKSNSFIPVEEEILNLTNYVDIVKLRFEPSFTVRYDIARDVAQDLIPRLLLQPIVENAVIHGLDGARANGLIEVTASRREQNLVFTIRDNGKGMKRRDHHTKAVKLSGIGLRNVNERLRLIYGPSCGLRSRSSPGKGTTVTLVIPAVPRRRLA